MEGMPLLIQLELPGELTAGNFSQEHPKARAGLMLEMLENA